MQAQIVGSLLILVTSWCYAIVCIQTRIMQSLSPFVLNSYYAIVAAISTLILILAESAITGEPVRIFSYDRSQYIAALVCCALNVVGMTCQTIALQNEKSVLITMLGYISLVYAFLGDTFIFHETLII